MGDGYPNGEALSSMPTVSAMSGSFVILIDPCQSTLLDFKLHEVKENACFIHCGCLFKIYEALGKYWLNVQLVSMLRHVAYLSI